MVVVGVNIERTKDSNKLVAVLIFLYYSRMNLISPKSIFNRTVESRGIIFLIFNSPFGYFLFLKCVLVSLKEKFYD